jgi:hypothetical protein
VKTRTKLILAAVVIAAAVAGWLLVKDDVKGLFAVLGAGGLASLLKAKKPTVNEDSAKKAGEDAKQKILDTPSDTVVASLDADTRAGIDAAKQSGLDAGIAAGLAYLHGSAGDPGAKGGDSGGP